MSRTTAPTPSNETRIRELIGNFDEFILTPRALRLKAQQLMSLADALELGDAHAELFPSDPVGVEIDRIIEAICARFRVDNKKLMSKARNQPVALARQVGMYIARKLSNKSYPVIGDKFDRDHSTVIHAHDLIARRCKNEPGFARFVQSIMDHCDTAKRLESATDAQVAA
jgi:chromosomal replication initiation ATPase DnaA